MAAPRVIPDFSVVTEGFKIRSVRCDDGVGRPSVTSYHCKILTDGNNGRGMAQDRVLQVRYGTPEQPRDGSSAFTQHLCPRVSNVIDDYGRPRKKGSETDSRWWIANHNVGFQSPQFPEGAHSEPKQFEHPPDTYPSLVVTGNAHDGFSMGPGTSARLSGQSIRHDDNLIASHDPCFNKGTEPHRRCPGLGPVVTSDNNDFHPCLFQFRDGYQLARPYRSRYVRVFGAKRFRRRCAVVSPGRASVRQFEAPQVLGRSDAWCGSRWMSAQWACSYSTGDASQLWAG
ncbi:hypothetical protein NOCARDAX2BIS_80034 [Nocardioides sp. AX2bis]|nr:hypothetical protein NOCARDAX2BIS_80034 [Nocardioides sp. AX2bis]